MSPSAPNTPRGLLLMVAASANLSWGGVSAPIVPVLNRSVRPLCIPGNNAMNTHKKCQSDWIDLHVRATSVLRDSISIGIMCPSFLICNRTSASLDYIIYSYTDLIQVIFSLGIDNTARFAWCDDHICIEPHVMSALHFIVEVLMLARC
jgi:hypothetical protein